MTPVFSARVLSSAVLLASLALAGCGGGGGGGAGGDSPAATNTSSLTGTAAIGAPLANAALTLKDSAGKTLTTTADAKGAYTFADVTGLTAPLMVRATGTAGGVEYKLHSVLTTVPAAGVSGVLNVTPATESVVAQTLGLSPATVFDAADAGGKIKAIDPTKLADAKAKLTAALTDVLKALGQDATADLFSTAFAANGQGLDKLLDMIQFQAQASDDGLTKDVVITDKSTKVGIKVTQAAKVEEVAKVAAPSKEDVALDTTTIKALIDALNVQLKTEAGISSDAMLDLFDAAYLDSGMNRAAMMKNLLEDAVGVQFLDYVLQGCKSEASVAICNTELTGKQTDGSTFQFATKIKKGSDGKWRAYGNQARFDFDFKPLVTANYYVSNGLFEQDGSTQTGFNLWFPSKDDRDTTRTFKSATLQTSLDGGATWSTPIKFAEKVHCLGSSYLPLDDSSNTNNARNCGNFVAVSNAEAIANNAATLQGKRKFKITAYATTDYTGTAVVHEAQVTKLDYTSATGKATLDASTASVTAADVGTNSVRFTGPLHNLTMYASTAAAEGSIAHTGTINWEDSELTAMKGVVSIEKANALCKSYGDESNSCNSFYGPNARITRVYLDARDAQGRGILKSYSASKPAS